MSELLKPINHINRSTDNKVNSNNLSQYNAMFCWENVGFGIHEDVAFSYIT